MTACLQLIPNIYYLNYLCGYGCVYGVRCVTLMENSDYCDLRLGVQVMSACLVNISVAGRVAIAPWLCLGA